MGMASEWLDSTVTNPSSPVKRSLKKKPPAAQADAKVTDPAAGGGDAPL